MTAQHDSGQLRHVPVATADVPVLDIRGVSKTYTTVPVLDGIDLQAHRGEVLGLLGANGAGKSTLLKIIAGVVPPSAGRLAVSGDDVNFARWGPREAAGAGIHMVTQELSAFTNISVAENFSMANADLRGQSRRAVRSAASAALGTIFPGSDIPVRAETGGLSIAERQMVEIAIAASQPGLSILIMDEPTSALPAERAAQLHSFLRARKADGILIIYVTHKLDEVLDIADRLVVLRDGRIHWAGDPATVTHAELLVKLGARVAEEGAAEPAAEAPGTAAATMLTPRAPHPSAGRGVELQVAAGEVVGLAGLEGAGQRLLLREIYATSGKRRAAFDVPGVAYVSGDRKREGLFGLWSVAENLVISSVARLARFGVIRHSAVNETVRHWYDTLRVVAAGPETPIMNLSGGNQQKVIIARGFASEAPLILLDDPTRGVDIETKADFYRLLQILRNEQRSAILYSTEDREFSQCDRVYVMARGVIVKELAGADITRENIVHWSYAGMSGPTAAAPGEAPGPSQPVSSARSRSRPAWSPGTAVQGLRTSRLSMVAGLLIIMLIAMRITQPSSLTAYGLSLQLGPAMPLVLAALAQMLVIMGGDFDVGIGYAVGLANVISATTLVSDPLLGTLMLIGMIAGYAVMAVIVELAGVPAIVVTLGASFIWLGCGLVLQPTPGGTSPSWLSTPLSVSLQFIPLQVYLCIGLAAVMWFLLRRWRYGVALRGFGNSRQSFIETGRSPLRARLTIYMIAGLLVVLAGLLTTASTTASDINASSALTLASVAAVVIGGAEFSGGIVEPVGAVLAAVALGLVPSLLYFMQVSPNAQTAVEGLLLIAAMAVRRLARGART
jgi:ribose transport system ATP-binding protein